LTGEIHEFGDPLDELGWGMAMSTFLFLTKINNNYGGNMRQVTLKYFLKSPSIEIN